MYCENAMLHPSEKYYPLRPELVESTAMLWFATGDDSYRRAGARIAEDIERHTRVEGGAAAVRDVETMTLENHMPSFFLAADAASTSTDLRRFVPREKARRVQYRGTPRACLREEATALERSDGESKTRRRRKHPGSRDPLAPFESREFVRVVPRWLTRRRARRERGSAEDDPRRRVAARATPASTAAAAAGLDLDLVPEVKQPAADEPSSRASRTASSAMRARDTRAPLGRHRARPSQSPRPARRWLSQDDVLCRRRRRRRRVRRRWPTARGRRPRDRLGFAPRARPRQGREAEDESARSSGPPSTTTAGTSSSRELPRDGERVSRARQRSASRVRSDGAPAPSRRDGVTKAEVILRLLCYTATCA